MRYIRALVLLISLMLSSWAIGDTSYNFSFTTKNGISVSGTISLNDSGVLTSGTGTLNGGSVVSSGTLTSFALINQSPWQFTFVVSGVTYYVNYAASQYIGGAFYNGSLSYSPSTGTDIVSGFTESVTPTASVTPADPVPEIDGDKLPQAALMIAAIFLLFRNRIGPDSGPTLRFS